MGEILPKVQSENGIEGLVRRVRDWGSGRHGESLGEAHDLNNKSMYSVVEILEERKVQRSRGMEG